MFEFLPTPIQDIKLSQAILDKHFIQVPQRSSEWLILQEFYKTGTNNHNFKKTMEGYYNLIRGAITENILINILDLPDYDKVIPGILVTEKDNKGSLGCSPDLLFVKNNKIIPVEIKTLPSLTKTQDYYNKYELAQKQLESVSDILNEVVIKKMIIMSAWTGDNLIYEVHFI